MKKFQNNSNTQFTIVTRDFNTKIDKTEVDEEATLLNSPVVTNPKLAIPSSRNVRQDDGHGDVQMG